MKRLLLYAAALVLLLSLLLLCAACGEKPENDGSELPDPQIAADGDEAPIQWQEPVLEALVREKLGKPEGDIYPSELNPIFALDILGDTHVFFNNDERSPFYAWGSTETYDHIFPPADMESPELPPKDGVYIVDGKEYSRGSISSLADLAHFHNLTTLCLFKINLTDLSGLEDLPLQTFLSVDCGLVSIEALSHVKALNLVQLVSENVRDLSPLVELPALDMLSINNCPIEDLSAVRDMPALLNLYISNAPLADIQGLTDTMPLEKLTLNGTQVTDLSPLGRLPKLDGLSLVNLPLEQSDWETFFAPPPEQLRYIFLSCNRITDLRFLEGMEKLETLYLSKTQVTDLAPLRALPGLKKLILNDLETDRLDLSPLAGLSLRELSLRQDRAVLEGLSALEGMTELESLTILDSVGLSQEDIDRLREALPGCEIR